MDKSILDEKRALLLSDYTPKYEQLYIHPEEGEDFRINSALEDIKSDIDKIDKLLIDKGNAVNDLLADTIDRLDLVKSKILTEKERIQDIKMLCTEDGIVPGVGAWGFNNQFTSWNDASGKKFQDKSYVYTEDNLYYIEKAGTLDINNKPTHTEGVSICGECELQWIDKIAKVELIEIV